MTRRSSRARTSQPSPAILHHTNSSSSSTNSRGERNTRSNHKAPSRRSSTQRSQSIDDADGGSRIDFPHTRQRHRTQDDDDPDKLSKHEGDDDDEDGDEEEEVTRCLCRQQDYPGLPPSRRESLGRSAAAKNEALNISTDSSDLLSDDIGSMFIQCDSCKVWQHGGCVGIMDEAMSPDEYYCEECRKDLHRIRSEPNGQSSSQYLPVAPSSPAVSSRASSRDTSKRVKDPKLRHSDSSNPKRRSTMNSRDAAYDEAEQLRRAIEESKEETKSTAEEVAKRRGKRSRSDSETNKQTAKRQRTSSPSPSASKQSNSISQPASDDESKAKAATNGARKVGARQREKESKDTEEEDRETASRKKNRADRRKTDESDHEAESPEKPAANEPEPSQPSPETPVTAPEPAPSRPSTRKSGRPSRRGGKLGRNQYTRDRDLNGNGEHANSPRRGQSHEMSGDSPRVRANGVHLNGEAVKPSKPRYMNPHRTTMTEMKRRVAGILEFISRMQIEMAVSGESASTPDQSNGASLKNMVDQIEGAMAPGSDGDGPTTDGEGSQASKEKDFKSLSSVEMMDALTRRLLKWQQEYGKFGEK